MKIKKMKSVDLDRIERAYLASLRVAILGFATLCLLGAIFFGVNAAWRVLVSTKVEEKPVQVTGAQVAAELKKAAPERSGPRQADEIPAPIRQAHARWSRDVFPGYYAVYRSAAQAYKKPEDELLSSAQLMDALGYDLQTFADDDKKASAFVLNGIYQQQALAAVTAAMKDPAVVSHPTFRGEHAGSLDRAGMAERSRRTWRADAQSYDEHERSCATSKTLGLTDALVLDQLGRGPCPRSRP